MDGAVHTVLYIHVMTSSQFTIELKILFGASTNLIFFNCSKNKITVFIFGWDRYLRYAVMMTVAS